MPASKDSPAQEPEPKAPKAPPKAERWELMDELERLKAEGNKNPARLAELKKLLVEG